jgi:hypothetical protein
MSLLDAAQEGSKIKQHPTNEEIFFDALDQTPRRIYNHLTLMGYSLSFSMALFIGFTVWWAYLPELANLVPSQTLNPKWIEVVKQLVEGVCQNTQMGDACQCVSKIHTESASIVNDAWAQAVGVEKPDFEFLVQIPAKGQGQGSQTKSPYSVHAVEVSDAGYFSRMENN